MVIKSYFWGEKKVATLNSFEKSVDKSTLMKKLITFFHMFDTLLLFLLARNGENTIQHRTDTCVCGNSM